MFADLDTNGDSMYVLFIIKISTFIFSNRVSIDELQKHTELDTDGENEFTNEEVRVRILIYI
jgi:hypothetical protein